MIYNIFEKDSSKLTLSNILKDTEYKAVIACTNSFVASSIINDLKTLPDFNQYNFYNGNICISDFSRSNNVIITSFDSIESINLSIIDSTYSVIVIDRTEASASGVFNISVHKAEEYYNFNKQEETKTEPYNSTNIVSEPTEVTPIKQIEIALKSNNVIFIQDINDSVIKHISDNYPNVVVVDSYDSFKEFYSNINSEKPDSLIITFSCPEDLGTIIDCKQSLVKVLNYNVTVVCDISWIKTFLDASVEIGVNISSNVIYNGTKDSNFGNQSLFSKYIEE